jgi:hypothetical protein
MHIRAGVKGSVGFGSFKEKLFLETLDLQTSRVSEAKSLPPGCPNRVKLRRTQCEQMSSGLALKADIAQTLTSQPNQLLDLKWNTNGRRPKGADGLPAPLKLLVPETTR